MSRLLVQQRQRAPHDRVAQSCEPASLLGRQRLEVPPDDLDEQELADSKQNAITARAILARFVQGELDQAIQSVAEGGARAAYVDQPRQRRQYWIERKSFAAQKAAYQAKAFGSAAAVFENERQLARRQTLEEGQVLLERQPGFPAFGRGEDVGIAVRDDEHVTRFQPHCGLTQDSAPARALGDDVVRDEMPGARKDQRGDRRRRWNLDEPWGCRVDHEEQRPAQPHGPKDVG
jgi:hypothetical protein